MLLGIVHFLHLLAGVVWAGGAIFFAFVLEPTMLRLGPAAARDIQEKARPFAGALMSSSGMLLLLTGLARPVMGGGITSFGDLLKPYGLYVLAALIIVLAVTILSGRHRAAMASMLENATETTRAMRAAQFRQSAVTGAGIFATIGIMAILGMGLY